MTDAPTPDRIHPPDVTIVTGAAGWLGRALVDHLSRAEAPYARPGQVRALVRDAEDLTDFAGSPGWSRCSGTSASPDGLDALFTGLGGIVDVVHTAGCHPPARGWTTSIEINARGTANVMAAAAAAGVRRVVHVSSNSPFGTNPHPGDTFRNDEPYHPYYGYGRSKMQAELRVLEAVDRGLDAVIVRPPWFYGPFQPPRQTTFFRMVRKGRFPVIGGGEQRRSMVYVDNLVQGVVAAELVPTPAGRAWWIADARPYTVDEIVETVGRALDRRGLRRPAQPVPSPGAGRPARRARRTRWCSAPGGTCRRSTCWARWTRRSPATSPTPGPSWVTNRRWRWRRGCDAASGGAWSKGSRCDQPGHGRQRLLRTAPGGPAGHPGGEGSRPRHRHGGRRRTRDRGRAGRHP